ncbi:unnamed protein product [Rotaria magnacalcarata]|uniref:Uncharacterized protein n=1 Tax=Rotaria magnacalcarata TaxID=392030 RepID=A0A816TU16_9BILA|nr:unnamed protein product [Rotaria magnacalcarata]
MNQYDKKRKLMQQQNDDDEQIEKTLKYFDEILDEYLCDDDITDENTVHKSHSQTRFTNVTPVQHVKQSFQAIKSTPKTSSSISTFQDSRYIQASHQFHDNRHRFEQAASTDQANNVRRHTSENNLNQIASSTKPVSTEKTFRPQLLQTTATSTEDLLTVSSSRNFQAYDRFSVLMDKTNYLAVNNTSASLIDLTAIDKLSSRPRFRFVPPSNQNLNSKEEYIKQQQQSNQNFEQYHLKTIPIERSSLQNQNKYSHKIVKPTVVVPSMQKSVPINHLAESSIHHDNRKSAFKPHRSSKIDVSSKVQYPSPLSASKRRPDLLHQSTMHIGMTNPTNQIVDSRVPMHQKQKVPQFHQSIPNLTPKGTGEDVNSNMYASYISDQPKTSNFVKPPPYTPQSHKSNGHHPYQLPTSSQDSISRWIQQVNSSSSISGLVHSSRNQLYSNGGDYRSQQQQQQQQQFYPYGSHLPVNATTSQPVNISDRPHHHHHHHQQPTHMNPINVPKHISGQQSAPVPSAYPPSLSTSRNGIFSPQSSTSSSSSNIYHFHQNSVQREGQPKRNSHRQHVNGTSYL